ncbi:alpha/beta fold hydrolase [Aurantimonas sp. HBX-1]|uniref:alpha/beta fold hydrolase n=1 Tax=Aurantimonas sp. HBX-1 TaxID=2906072 RepID=UPI001F426FBB|nr:alpha/beta fold hydrolase [Aurantimonas sp. HBX-1]UIJ73730.1 alpha/beta hydrolase [Aurantimonas sp. HBX-1]
MARKQRNYRVEMVNTSSIVLIPGLLCTADLFRDQIAAFPPEALMVADTVSDDSIAAMAERLLAGAPPRFVLCGLSMGGYVALEVARRAPERVAGLAVVATSARPDTAEQTAVRHRLVALGRDKGIAAVAEALSSRLLGPQARQDEGQRDRVAAMAGVIGIETFARQQAAIIGRPDQRQALSGLAMPTHVLVGTADEIIPPDCSHEMAAAIPKARLTTVEAGGHLLSMEAPDLVTQALAALLAGSRPLAAQLEAGPNM